MKSAATPQRMCILTLLLLAFFVENVREFPLSTDSGDQYNPAVYGNIAVWIDERNGNKDIYGYNLTTGEEFQITSDPRDQCNPAIYENIVVWQDYRYNNWEIYGYNISTGEEFRITSNRYNQECPELFMNTVVWQDDRNGGWDIYGCNLLTGQEFQITNDPWSDESLPVIYGDTVVWLEDKKDCYMSVNSYNIFTGQGKEISKGSCKGYPSIYGDIVVWHDGRNNNKDIYGFNLLTGEEFQITNDKSDQMEPAIYGVIVVWHDGRNNNYDIYGYNLSRKEEFPIIIYPYSQQFPAIYEDTLVWHDTRNGNADIYGCTIHESPPDKDDNELSDNDGDGHVIPEDCNDNDPRIHPGAEEPCGEDYNCDGKVTPCTGALEVIVNFQEGGLKAKVYLDENSVGETDPEGRLIISDLEADTKYTVRVEAEGYYQEEVIIHIEKGMKTYVEFSMERKVTLLMKIKVIKLITTEICDILISKTEFIENPLVIRATILCTIATSVVSLLRYLYRFFTSSKGKKES